MLPGPNEHGQAISIDGLNRIKAEIAARTVGYGKQALVHQGSNGTLLFRRPTGLFPGGRLYRALHPFMVSNASASGTAKVRVRFGQVNSVTPEMNGATPLDDPTPPEMTVISGVVYLEVSLDGSGNVTAADIGNAASLPANTATEGYITLATITVSSGNVTAINQAVTHSLGHQKCGSTTHNFWGL